MYGFQKMKTKSKQNKSNEIFLKTQSCLKLYFNTREHLGLLQTKVDRCETRRHSCALCDNIHSTAKIMCASSVVVDKMEIM